MTSDPFDQTEFRKTLGQFATGVTIITTLAADKTPVGITASSFNSLSLDPPMVLWSLAKSAYSMTAFSAAKYYNIHILGRGQDEISNVFASQGADKFCQVACKDGLGGTPILPEYAALFECESAHQYEGGDHIIFVGLVKSFKRNKQKPLVFHQGQYTGIDSLI
ncbi:MAG TPA: flavin reductase [Hellea balneolensis]|uniref:Flavin reductase n=1 Tax=Hellea balneolensis TaxID=287478 RepID=A0A7C5LZY2_9PROT|nr:flavin reductase [Hellea balneolensis]